MSGYPPVGSRVRLAHDVERFPHFVAPAGALGTVVYVDADLLRVRLDDELDGADTWDNEIVWSLRDDDVPGDALDVLALAPAPSDADYVRLEALEALDADGLRRVIAYGGPSALIDAAVELEQRRGAPAPVYPCPGCNGARSALCGDCEAAAREARETPPAAAAELEHERSAARQIAAYVGERRRTDEADEVASADVVLALTLADAHAVADGLELLADLDEGEHVDDETLRRLAALVRSRMPLERQAAVERVLATMPADGTPLEFVEAADRALATLPGYIGSVPEGRAFVADVLFEGAPDGGREGLAAWLVDELTAE